MTIKEVLEHPWIKKHIKSNIIDERRKSKDGIPDFKMYTSDEK